MNALQELIRAAAEPLTGSPGDYDPLLGLVGEARFVLLGEASHGTHEFYRGRSTEAYGCSTPSFTSITPAPSSRWSVPPSGMRAKWRRHFHREFER
jgi:hypothetical protein